jgi:hypothetical protein
MLPPQCRYRREHLPRHPQGAYLSCTIQPGRNFVEIGSSAAGAKYRAEAQPCWCCRRGRCITTVLPLGLAHPHPPDAPVYKCCRGAKPPQADRSRPDRTHTPPALVQDKWSAAYSVRTVLVSIQSLLGDPNNDSPLNSFAASLWASPEVTNAHPHTPPSLQPSPAQPSPMQ